MKELDEYFTQNGTPVPIGLADEVLPLLMKTRGVLEDALAHEAQIKRQEAESAPITS
jgi:hypothetical protein